MNASSNRVKPLVPSTPVKCAALRERQPHPAAQFRSNVLVPTSSSKMNSVVHKLPGLPEDASETEQKVAELIQKLRQWPPSNPLWTNRLNVINEINNCLGSLVEPNRLNPTGGALYELELELNKFITLFFQSSNSSESKVCRPVYNLIANAITLLGKYSKNFVRNALFLISKHAGSSSPSLVEMANKCIESMMLSDSFPLYAEHLLDAYVLHSKPEGKIDHLRCFLNQLSRHGIEGLKAHEGLVLKLIKCINEIKTNEDGSLGNSSSYHDILSELLPSIDIPNSTYDHLVYRWVGVDSSKSKKTVEKENMEAAIVARRCTLDGCTTPTRNSQSRVREKATNVLSSGSKHRHQTSNVEKEGAAIDCRTKASTTPPTLPSRSRRVVGCNHLKATLAISTPKTVKKKTASSLTCFGSNSRSSKQIQPNSCLASIRTSRVKSIPESIQGGPSYTLRGGDHRHFPPCDNSNTDEKHSSGAISAESGRQMTDGPDKLPDILVTFCREQESAATLMDFTNVLLSSVVEAEEKGGENEVPKSVENSGFDDMFGATADSNSTEMCLPIPEIASSVLGTNQVPILDASSSSAKTWEFDLISVIGESNKAMRAQQCIADEGRDFNINILNLQSAICSLDEQQHLEDGLSAEQIRCSDDKSSDESRMFVSMTAAAVPEEAPPSSLEESGVRLIEVVAEPSTASISFDKFESYFLDQLVSENRLNPKAENVYADPFRGLAPLELQQPGEDFAGQVVTSGIPFGCASDNEEGVERFAGLKSVEPRSCTYRLSIDGRYVEDMIKSLNIEQEEMIKKGEEHLSLFRSNNNTFEMQYEIFSDDPFELNVSTDLISVNYNWPPCAEQTGDVALERRAAIDDDGQGENHLDSEVTDRVDEGALDSEVDVVATADKSNKVEVSEQESEQLESDDTLLPACDRAGHEEKGMNGDCLNLEGEQVNFSTDWALSEKLTDDDESGDEEESDEVERFNNMSGFHSVVALRGGELDGFPVFSSKEDDVLDQVEMSFDFSDLESSNLGSCSRYADHGVDDELASSAVAAGDAPSDDQSPAQRHVLESARCSDETFERSEHRHPSGGECDDDRALSWGEESDPEVTEDEKEAFESEDDLVQNEEELLVQNEDEGNGDQALSEDEQQCGYDQDFADDEEESEQEMSDGEVADDQNSLDDDDEEDEQEEELVQQSESERSLSRGECIDDDDDDERDERHQAVSPERCTIPRDTGDKDVDGGRRLTRKLKHQENVGRTAASSARVAGGGNLKHHPRTGRACPTAVVSPRVLRSGRSGSNGIEKDSLSVRLLLSSSAADSAASSTTSGVAQTERASRRVTQESGESSSSKGSSLDQKVDSGLTAEECDRSVKTRKKGAKTKDQIDKSLKPRKSDVVEPLIRPCLRECRGREAARSVPHHRDASHVCEDTEVDHAPHLGNERTAVLKASVRRGARSPSPHAIKAAASVHPSRKVGVPGGSTSGAPQLKPGCPFTPIANRVRSRRRN